MCAHWRGKAACVTIARDQSFWSDAFGEANSSHRNAGHRLYGGGLKGNVAIFDAGSDRSG